MTTEHTEGPWHATDTNNVLSKYDAWVCNCEPISESDWQKIGEDDLKRAAANARLIAAAPDLLAALNRLIDDQPEVTAEGYEQALKAIAKATGKPK